MVIYPVDSATVISCRAYILLHSKPLLSNMYSICISVCPSIFFSVVSHIMCINSLFKEIGYLQFPPVFFLFLLVLSFFVVVCLFVCFFFFMFALSQFSGPDYLGAWNRLVPKMFVAIGITLCFISGKKCKASWLSGVKRACLSTQALYYCVRILTYVYWILSTLTSSFKACVAIIMKCGNGMCKPLKILYHSKTVGLENLFLVSADGCVHW